MDKAKPVPTVVRVPEEQKKETAKELEGTWRRFAELLVEMEEVWERHRDIMSREKERIYLLPEDVQKHLSKVFNLSRFSIALPRILDYARSIGGVKNLLIGKEAKDDGKD